MLQILVPGIGYVKTVVMAVWFVDVCEDKLVGHVNVPLLQPHQEDVVDSPLDLWASSHGYESADNLYLAELQP